MTPMQNMPIGRPIVRIVRSEHGQRLVSIPKPHHTALRIDAGSYVSFQRFADGTLRIEPIRCTDAAAALRTDSP